MKPCTKPVLFNLSHAKSSRTPVQSQRPLHVSALRTGTQATQPEKTLHTAHLKSKMINEKLQSATPNTQNTQFNMDLAVHLSTPQHLATRKANPGALSQSNGESAMGTEKPQRHQPSSAVSSLSHVPKQIAKPPGSTLHVSRQPGYSSTFASGSVGISNPLSSIPNQMGMHKNGLNSLAHSAFAAEDCLKNLDLLSLKDPSNILHTSQPRQCAPSANLPNASAGE